MARNICEVIKAPTIARKSNTYQMVQYGTTNLQVNRAILFTLKHSNQRVSTQLKEQTWRSLVPNLVIQQLPGTHDTLLETLTASIIIEQLQARNILWVVETISTNYFWFSFANESTSTEKVSLVNSKPSMCLVKNYVRQLFEHICLISVQLFHLAPDPSQPSSRWRLRYSLFFRIYINNSPHPTKKEQSSSEHKNNYNRSRWHLPWTRFTTDRQCSAQQTYSHVMRVATTHLILNWTFWNRFAAGYQKQLIKKMIRHVFFAVGSHFPIPDRRR